MEKGELKARRMANSSVSNQKSQTNMQNKIPKLQIKNSTLHYSSIWHTTANKYHENSKKKEEDMTSEKNTYKEDEENFFKKKENSHLYEMEGKTRFPSNRLKIQSLCDALAPFNLGSGYLRRSL